MSENEELIHALWDINHKMRRLHDGKASQSRILIILKEHGCMTQRDLTEHLDIRPGSASEIISKLERNGLVKRTTNESDRRTVDLTLTEKGGTMAEEALAGRIRLHKEMLSCLSDGEKDTLLNLLTTLQDYWCEHYPDEMAR